MYPPLRSTALLAAGDSLPLGGTLLHGIEQPVDAVIETIRPGSTQTSQLRATVELQAV